MLLLSISGMKKRILLALVILFFGKNLFAQKQTVIHTGDIDNFWIAYDSIVKTSDLSKKISIINSQYIDKGSNGLKAFMELRNYNDTLWVKLIDSYPKFWNSIRQKVLG